MIVYLVGGLTLHENYFEDLSSELSKKGFTVHVCAYPRKSSTREYIDKLIEQVDTPGVWLGHSFGCQVVEEIARKHPSKVNSLVLAGPAEVSRGYPGLIKRLLFDATQEPVSLIFRALYDLLIRTGIRRSLKEAKFSKILWRKREQAKLEMPSLVVHGSRDLFTSFECSKKLSERLGADFQVVFGGGHGFPYSHPKDLADIVEDFANDSSLDDPK